MIRIKKSKKIFYCITSFALVSLATIGFSSWIISIEQPNQDFNVSINVDAMSFETVICDVKLKEENPTITLGPSSISDDGIVGGDGQNNEDLSASIEGNLIVADEMVEKIDKVTINLTSHKGNEQTNYNAISISNTDIFGRTPGTYYYLSPSITEIQKSDMKFETYEVDGFQSASLNALNDLTLLYGNYFDGQNNPSTFYSNKLSEFRQKYIDGDIEASEYLNAIRVAQGEIETMETNLQSLTIQISTVLKTGN